MSAEENKALIRRFAETVWNNKQVDALEEFHAAEFTLNGEPYTAARFKEQLQGFFVELVGVRLLVGIGEPTINECLKAL